MDSIITVLQIVLIFLIPALLVKYSKSKLLSVVGTIGAAYIAGLFVASAVYLAGKAGADIALNGDVGQIGSYAAIGVAIPLLLFNSDLRGARLLSKKVLVSFAVLTASVTVVTAVVFYVYGYTLPNGGVLSAMAAGLYTGGTPNLNAIGNIFGLDAATIGVANISDMLIGGVFYLFLLTAARPLLKRFLKTAKDGEVYMKGDSGKETKASGDEIGMETVASGGETGKETAASGGETGGETKAVRDGGTADGFDGRGRLFGNKRLLINFGIALGMTAAGAAIGIAIWLLTGAKEGRMTDFLVPSVMITVTVLGIIGSFNKKICAEKKSGAVGQYFILVFSFALAMSVNIEHINGSFAGIMPLYAIITVAVFVLHIIISKLVKTDVDCALVTLTAGIYGPAFVPAITKQLKKDSLNLPGLICGSLGYAIGTFLGIGLGLLFLLRG
ncbi:MAG: DUF819 family protein [Clostridiales bacterium]|jgi:uncharacterized membrane protein|nr:DUF819 family protein [Clostridiales bacterium]